VRAPGEAPPERAKFFDAFIAAASSPGITLGRCDASMLAPMLSRIPPAPGTTAATPHLVIDIGANVGDTTDDLVHFFTSASCLSYHTAFPEITSKSTFDPCDERAAKVLSYEPMPANFDALVARGAHAHWLASVWTPYPIVVTSPARVPASGVVDFFSAGTVGDQQGALSPGAAYTDAAHKIVVQATTLDAHLAALGLQTTPILLLKIDTEGFDADVLLGAAAVLARQQARVVTFEYNTKWAEAPGTSLATTIKALAAAAYDCYFVTPDNLVPLSGSWWVDGYEIWKWSNVICFRSCDQLVQLRVLTFYNKITVDPAVVVGCAPPACTECAALS
jgi:FkbM family methyltransferase